MKDEELILLSSLLFDSTVKDLDYQRLTKLLCQLSGAKYGVFNLYSENSPKLITVGIHGPSNVITKAGKLLGINLLNKEWEVSVIHVHGLSDGIPVRYESLSHLVKDAIPPLLCKTIETTFKLGCYYVFQISSLDKLLGDYILFFEKGSDIVNLQTATTYSKLVGTVLARKKLENDLVESEKRFRSIFENSTMGLYRTTPDGKVLIANKALLDILGYDSLDEMKAVNIETTGYENPQQRVLFKSIIESQGEIYGFESAWKKSNGQVIHVRESAKVYRNSDGSVKYYEGTCEDITERIRAEQELAKSEQNYKHLQDLFRNVADIIPDMLWAKDLNKKYLFANKAICNNLLNANDISEPLGKDDMFFAQRERESHPDDKNWHTFGEICRDSDTVVLESGETGQFDEYGNVKGKFLYLDVIKTPLRNDKGEIIGVVGTARDVTVNKKAELMLRQSEANLKAIIENSLENIWSINTSYEIQYINEVFVKIYEEVFSVKLQVGNNILDYLPESMRDTWKQRYDRAFSNEHFTFEDRVIHGGLTVDIDVSMNPIVVEEKVVGVSCYGRVITAQKIAEEQLIQTKQTYQDIYNTLTEAIYILDENYTFIDVNKGAELMYGFPREEMIGKNPGVVAAPGMNDMEGVLARMAQIPVTGKAARFDFWALKKNGELFLKDVIVSKGRYFGKDVLIATARDITEKRRTDQQLEYQSELRQLLIGLSSNFINLPGYELDSAIRASLRKIGEFVGADRSYIIDYDFDNNIALNLIEWQREGVSPSETEIQAISLEGFEEWLQLHKKGEGVQIDDVSKLTTDNVKTLLEGQQVKSVLTVPMMDENTCLGFVGLDSVREKHFYSIFDQQLLQLFAQMLVNVKKRINTEDSLIIAKEKAEESNRLKSAFLANMSHEIRTPMNGILGFVEILKDFHVDADKRKQYFEIVLKSGQRLLRTINDLIEISKIEAGHTEVNITETSVPEVMNFHFTFFKPQTIEKGLEFFLNEKIPGDVEWILTDRHKLDSILSNLLSNAVKYTKAGTIELGNYLDDHYISFYVKDSGIGIPEEMRDIIFERFIQADMKNTRTQEGSGLGLSICKAYAEQINGKLWLESEIGKGSTFFLSIPYRPVKKLVSVTDVHHVPTLNFGSKNLVVVAEDDEASFELISNIFDDTGIRLIHTTNGKETVEAVRNNSSISLVLMDIRMPVMNGLEATRQIRQFNKTIPIIAQTAYALSGDMENAILAGCNDYISKPIHRSEILEKVYDFLKK
jgi:PAS domain S-box-containing protein